ncbi:MAG: amino acid ABC transporter substrate-binding protein [Variovorax sp.]|nr:MAG: amino acid ABC transporter substrate-binding protein [Variovorax sp.]
MIRSRRKMLAVTAATILAAATATPSLAQNANAPFKIGVLIALSGPAAAYGAEERRAVEAVAKKVNDQGGINGRKIELIVRDTKTNPTEAARLANQVISDDKVIAIIGGTTGSETMAFADAAMRAEVPMFPMVGTPSVTDPAHAYSKWVFRMSVPLNTDLTAAFGRFVKDGKKRMAIFSEEDAYGQQGAAMAVAMAKKHGGVEVVENISAPKTATDLTTQATKIRNAKPDGVIMITASTGSGGAFLRKLQQVGVDVPVYGMAGIVQKQILTSGGKAAEMLIAPALVNPHEAGPLTELFALMKDSGGVDGFGAVLGANAAAAVVEALRSGATTGAQLRDAMEKIGPIKGYAAGPIRFTPTDHDSWGPETVFFVTVRDGKFKNL